MFTNKQLYLASSSPRRQELVRMLGLPFEIRVSDADETTEPGLPPADIVATLALRKALTVLHGGLPEPGVILGADTIVVVDGKVLGKPQDEEDAFRMLTRLQGRTHEVYSGVALVDAEFKGSIAAEESGIGMAGGDGLAGDGFAGDGLASEESAQAAPGSGGRTRVGDLAQYRTLAASRDGQAEVLSGCSVSKVTFRPMSESEIRAYVATGEPMDKAGSYGVQGLGSIFIEKIEGDFYSVMGLPLNLLYPMLAAFGIRPFGI